MATEVVGVDQQSAHLEMARRLGFIHRGLEDPARGVMGAEAVVLALPLDKLFVTLEKAAPQMRPGAMVTCTAGTPRRLCRQIINEIPSASGFVPSFPLVFSDSQGPAAASSALLMGRQCIVGNAEEFNPEMVGRVQRFWQALGMQPVVEEMEKFEWSVTGRHFWPLLVTSIVSEMARKRDWQEGHTVLNRWLQSVIEPDDLERSYQLNASKLSALLDELGKLISRRSRSLGGGTTVPKMEAGKPGPEDADG
jgi:hypothetical protein